MNLLAVAQESASNGTAVVVFLVIWGLIGWAGWGIGKGKGKAGLGLTLGLLLGLIGLLIIACVPESAEHRMQKYQEMANANAAANARFAPPVAPPVGR